VKEEMNAALVTTIEQRGAKLLPVLLEQCELPPLLSTRRYADLSRPYTRHTELQALFTAMELMAKVDCPVLFPDEVEVLNILRGKPDIKWTPQLIAKLLASNQPPITLTAENVEATVESLSNQGYLLKYKSGVLEVSERGVEFFRSRGRQTKLLEPFR
jgi:hypothetical protein